MSENSKTRDAGRSRRRFLVEGASALSAVTLGGAATGAGAQNRPTETAREESEARNLRALAEVALPTRALGPQRLEQAVVRFERWRDGFRPVAELDHPYLSTDQIRYGPPDPRPAWSAQLEALEIEARERYDEPWAELDRDRREELLRSHLRRHLPRGDGAADLPNPTEAPHVAIALISWFSSTPAANDLCYGRAIRRHSCRGLPSAVPEPAPLGDQPLFSDE